MSEHAHPRRPLARRLAGLAVLAALAGAAPPGPADALFDRLRLGMPRAEALPWARRPTRVGELPGRADLSFDARGALSAFRWRRTVAPARCGEEQRRVLEEVEARRGFRLYGPTLGEVRKDGRRTTQRCFSGRSRGLHLHLCCSTREPARPARSLLFLSLAREDVTETLGLH